MGNVSRVIETTRQKVNMPKVKHNTNQEESLALHASRLLPLLVNIVAPSPVTTYERSGQTDSLKRF